MKRERDEEPLGATEFSSILNGDDARSIAHGLRRFAIIVRAERGLSLGGKSNQPDSQDDNDDDDLSFSEEKESKRQKNEEEWKKDKGNYNVPFVGTSVSSKDRGKIVRNQWPTGLLKAYLEKSPLAVELTGDRLVPKTGAISRGLLRQKQNKLHVLFSKHYLKALAEVVTCAVPVERLRDEITYHEEATASQYTSLISHILKSRLGNLLDLLKAETENGKGKSSIEGGCGPSAPMVVDVLTMLSMTSLATARHIVRSIEQRLPAGTIRFLIRTPNKASEGTTSRDTARIATFRLLTILLSYPDSVVANCIASAGSREKKTPPGLLYLVCKEGFGLPRSILMDKAARALCGILRQIKTAIGNQKKVMSLNMILDLLSDDFLTALVNLSSTSSDQEESNEHFKELVWESQCFISDLLSPEKGSESPLLSGASSRSKAMSKRANESLVHIMTLILDKRACLKLQRSMIKCLEFVPGLLPPLYAQAKSPDLASRFPLIHWLHVLSEITRKGPPLRESIPEEDWESNRILQGLLPVAFKKQTITKLMRDSNALVVAETLRLCVCAIRKLRIFGSETGGSRNNPLDGFTGWMPDANVIVAVLLSYGPAGENSNQVVSSRAAEVILETSDLVPRWVEKTKVDWALVLEETSFLRSRIVLQNKLLAAVLTVTKAQRDNSFAMKAMKPLFRLVLRTRSNSVYKKCREGLVILLVRQYRSATSLEALRHEASCWIDGMKVELIDEFIKCVTVAPSSSIHGWIECAKIWGGCELPALSTPPTSPLLLHCLDVFGRLSSSFRHLVCQVACRSTMFVTDSRHVSAVLRSKLGQALELPGTIVTPSVQQLQQYSTVLAAGENLNDNVRTDFLDSFLSNNSWLGGALKNAEIRPSRSGASIELLPEVAGVAVRYMQHSLLSARHGPWRDILFHKFKKLLLHEFMASPTLHIEDGETPLTFEKATAGVLGEAPAFELAMRYCTSHQVPFDWASVAAASSPREMLSTPNTRSQVLTAFLGAQKFPSQGLSEQAIMLLKGTLDSPEFEDTFSLLLLNHLRILRSRDFVCDKSTGLELLNLLVDVWADLDLRKSGEMLSAIQGTLTRILENPSLSRPLLSRLESKRGALGRSIEIEVREAQNEVTTLFSAKLLKADYCCFSEQYFDFLGKPNAMEKLDQAGSTLSLETLVEALKHFEETPLDADLKKERTCLIFRALNLLLKNEDINVTLFSDAILALDIETVRSADISDISSLVEAMVPRLDNSQLFPTPARIKLLRGLVHLLLSLSGSVSNDGYIGLATSHVGYLISNAERCLRSSRRSTENSNHAYSSLEILHDFWPSLARQKRQIISDESVVQVMPLVRSCAKHGLSNETQDGVRQKSLDFILSVTATLAEFGLHRYKAAVFQWITTHSSFGGAVGTDKPESEKRQVLNILLSCTQYASGSSIGFDFDVWSSVLAGYQAGLSETDCLARRFLYEYERLAEASSFVCYMETLKWGQRPESESSQNGWDWLPSWLEMPRINATLQNFPLFDMLIPPHNLPLCHPQSAEQSDIYSPGFILPLVLAALESRRSERKSANGTENAFLSTSAKPGTVFFQKVCEKGGLALALASLCSNCKSIRRVALSILSIANEMVVSEDAKKLSSWRERPQLALILHSARRALVREMSSLMTSSIDQSDLSVPQINPPCSIFLAKASLILTKPGDDLYPALNRYFLRIGGEHGAMEDIHQRQPAFISLFCSSATEESLARTERCWAIRTMRDSFISEACYGPLMACHGFELLLSRVEGLVISPDFAELDLIFGALHRIVENCGLEEIDILVSKYGLLPWLCSLIVGRRLHEKSQKTLGDILDLLSLVLERSREVSDPGRFVLLRSVSMVAIDRYLTLGGTASPISRQLRLLLEHILKRDGRGASGEISIGLATNFLVRLKAKKDCAEEILRYVCSSNIRLSEGHGFEAAKLCGLVLQILQLLPDVKENTCTSAMMCIVRVAKSSTKTTMREGCLDLFTASVRELCSKWRESRSAWMEFSSFVQQK